MAKTRRAKRRSADGDESAVRVRILDAAFAAFMAQGYAATSTLEIATRARVSKRELYALVGNKEEMLIACITNRSRRFQIPGELPEPRDRKGLQQLLAAFGAQLLREISDPAVVGVFRLAIAEATHAPEVARALDSIGGKAVNAALHGIMAGAVKAGLLTGDLDELAERFWGLLWGDLQVGLLLGVAERPGEAKLAARAEAAAAMFLRIYPAA
ncbi:MAG TPA: TetR/AcrR family transcriptional regulator [Gammaproteobacteria bacterium]|nr:TetR/AcrR family transcriptional regulator [Gammaproteobacteria bacterium]